MKYFFLFLVFFGSISQAAKDVGSGGNVVVCDANQPATVELLDYYEAREVRDIVIDLGPPELSVDEKVQLALSRLRRLNPSREARYQEYVKDFAINQKNDPKIKLEDISDSQHVYIPVGCHVEQVAVQRPVIFSQDKRYYINKNLWDRLSNDGKAGLILHEIIYREEISADQTTSIGARYFNSMISSHELDEMPLKNYLTQIAAKVPLPDFDYNGFTLAICKPALVDGKYSVCGIVDEEQFQSDVFTKGTVVPSWAPWMYGRKQFLQIGSEQLPIAGDIVFEKDGAVSTHYTRESSNTRLNYKTYSLLLHPHFEGEKCTKFWSCFSDPQKPSAPEINSIRVAADGNVELIYVWELFFATQSGTRFDCNDGNIEFLPNGMLSTCNVGTPTRFKTNNYDLYVSGPSTFFPDGSLRSASDVNRGWAIFPNGEKVGLASVEFNPDNSIAKARTISVWNATFRTKKKEFPPGSVRQYDAVNFDFDLGDGSVLIPFQGTEIRVHEVQMGLRNGVMERIVFVRLHQAQVFTTVDKQRVRFPDNALVYMDENEVPRGCKFRDAKLRLIPCTGVIVE